MNKVIMIGRLTKDPEIQTTNNGKTVARFNIAVSRNFKNENGEYESDFLNIIVWGKLAENCGKYLKKGSKIATNGRIQTRSYDSNDGTKKYVTEIIAEEIEFLDTKSSSNNEENKDKYGLKEKLESASEELKEISDDDLPF